MVMWALVRSSSALCIDLSRQFRVDFQISSSVTDPELPLPENGAVQQPKSDVAASHGGSSYLKLRKTDSQPLPLHIFGHLRPVIFSLQS